ncbi:MAG: hypothetical protein HQK55_16115 [Deltaproteobacteria bacterium]|nr:hypothetical protein [Deltaproteobacteria bacterium]
MALGIGLLLDAAQEKPFGGLERGKTPDLAVEHFAAGPAFFVYPKPSFLLFDPQAVKGLFGAA